MSLTISVQMHKRKWIAAASGLIAATEQAGNGGYVVIDMLLWHELNGLPVRPVGWEPKGPEKFSGL